MHQPTERVTRDVAQGFSRAAAIAFCVAGVPCLVIFLVRWFFNEPLSSFRPFLSDEVSYWHQALTFSAVGFRGGYYTFGELLNPSGVTPFGAHGPGFAIAYGVFGSLLGWHRHSPVVLNLAAASVAAWVWVTLSNLSTHRIALSGLLLVTYWPLVFWAPTGMQEAFHYAGAIATAGLFAHALGPSPRRGALIAGWITLAFLSLVRPTWLLLLPLWGFATSRTMGPRSKTATVGCAFLLPLLFLAGYSRTTAPFPTGFFFLRVLNFSEGAGAIWNNLRFNLLRTVEPSEYEFLELLLRAEYWCWLAAAVIVTWRFVSRPTPERSLTGPLAHLVLAIAAMSAALGLMLLLYTLTNWAEHRVLSAFLLFAALLCVAAPGRAAPILASTVILANLATVKPFLEAFDAERSANFVWDRRGLYELSDAIKGRIAYRPNESRWCNTLLTSQFPPHLIGVPAGIGISVVREPNEMRLPPHSHYLLLEKSALSDFSGPINTKEIVTLPYGTLYQNLDSGCS